MTARKTRIVAAALAASLFMVPASLWSDDTDLFATTSVNPNVLVFIDNSASMNSIVWHPDFDPEATYPCSDWDPDATYFVTSDWTTTACGVTRTVYHDSNASKDPVTGDRVTRWDGRYLNWYFSSPVSDSAYAEIGLGNNGFPSSCVGGSAFARYKRTRMNVAKQVLKDVVCQVNLVGTVRFGIGIFRSDDTDPNGAFVLEEIDVPSSNQQADLVSAIQSVDADTWTPLAEGLFQLYTYFMSRVPSEIPKGQDGSTPFPRYEYKTTTNGVGGPHTSTISQAAADPMQYACQKSFVLIVTDGVPTQDDFVAANPTDTGQGFDDFLKLIGDYNPDGETENDPDLVCVGCKTTLYLDDIAKYMAEKDFRPDMSGTQTIDTYTIGFATDAFTSGILSKTADVGNGIFFQADDEVALANAIIDSLSDIVEKAQSFTAATVPASRTSAGDQIYTSLFTPSSKTPYWDGHLRSYRLTAAGEIHDSTGQCAVQDPVAGQCFGGPFEPVDTHPPFWDAADAMPAASSRKLSVSRIDSGTNQPEAVPFEFDATPGANRLSAVDLGVTFPPANAYTGSVATDAEELTEEIIANVRGCVFGTGANGVACVKRASVLNDIFHANPIVIGQPALFASDLTYKDFVTNYAKDRDRVIYAGSNGGFLHGFDAGAWNGATNAYSVGSGAERFGFMPWPARQKIAKLPNDTGNRDYYFVDGSPTVADAFLYQSGNHDQPGPVSGADWHTVLVNGMRQGGETYFALDVTNPGASTCRAPGVPAGPGGYPCYLWEFPKENDPASIQDYVGQTWGDPIIARVKLDVGGVTVSRSVVVVTGGYSDTGDPADFAAYDSTATKGRSIWILDLTTGKPLAVRKFDSANNDCGAAYDPTDPEAQMCFAMPSTPAVYDTDGDDHADMILVGDLGGQLWKWVIKAPGFDPINTTKTLADNDAVWPFRKYFAAPTYTTGGNTFYKSIYFPPAATIKNGTLWYAFGTGERNDLLFAGDAGTTADNNRFYALRDSDPLDVASPTGVVGEGTLSDLTTNNACGAVSGADGYYVVGSEGEKWVTNIDIFSYFVLASSYVPVPAADPCELGGASYLWAFRVECGEGLFTDPTAGTPVRTLALGGGLPTDPKVSVSADGKTTRVIVNKQGGEIENVTGPPGFGTGTGMFYWREIKD